MWLFRKMPKNNLVCSSIFLSAIMFVSKLTGFLRETLLAYYYGTGSVTDAYVTASLVPSVLFAGITGAIVIAYIPICSKNIEDGIWVNKLTNNVLNVSCLFILVLSLVAAMFSSPFTRIFAMGFDESTHHIAVIMTIIILPFSLFFALSDILGAYLQSKNIFWFIGFSTLLCNLIIIASVPLSTINIWILPIGYGVGWLASSVFVYLLARRHDYRYNFHFQTKSSELKAIIVVATPVFIGTFVLRLHEIVDRNFASIFGTGVISSINYANKLNTLFSTLIIGSIATVIYPLLSRQSRDDDLKDFKKTSQQVYAIVLLIMIPLTVWLTIFAQPLIELVFMRGAFDLQAAVSTSSFLTVYGMGLPFISLNQILNNQFYALSDTKTPVICSVWSLIINIILTFLLSRFIGSIGIAIATTIGVLALTAMLNVFLQKKIGSISHLKLLRTTCKVLVSSTLMGLAMWFIRLFTFNQFSNIITMIIASILGMVVFLLSAFLLHVHHELDFKLIKK